MRSSDSVVEYFSTKNSFLVSRSQANFDSFLRVEEKPLRVHGNIFKRCKKFTYFTFYKYI